MTDKSDYDMIVGRCQGLEPSRSAGRALVRHKPPLEFQTANCFYRKKSMEEILDAFDSFVRSGKISRAISMPIMPDNVDIFKINKASRAPVLNIALVTNTVQPIGIDTVVNHLIIVAGDSGKGKSTVLASMVGYMLKHGNARVYLKDSLSAGLYAIAKMDNVVNLDELEDEYDFVSTFGALLDTRREELSECRRSGGDLAKLREGWEQIIFAVDSLLEFSESASIDMIDLMERIAKKEAGLKVAIWSSGNTRDISSSYETLIKAFKDAQCGFMLGSLKDRDLFNVGLPYGSFEKPEFGLCEGYLVIRNKYAEIKAAVDVELL